jgi:hypothetical protein
VKVRAVVNLVAKAAKMAVATGVVAMKPVAKLAVGAVGAAVVLTDPPQASVSGLMPRASRCQPTWTWRRHRQPSWDQARKRQNQKPAPTDLHAMVSAASVVTAVNVVSAAVANGPPKAVSALHQQTEVHPVPKDVASAVLSAAVARMTASVRTCPTKH